MTDTAITITEFTYHRNGVCGEGFHIARFTDDLGDEGTGEFVGVIFDGPGQVAVFRTDEVFHEHGVKFGINSWRGDRYEPALREAVADYDARPIDYSDPESWNWPKAPTVYPRAARPNRKGTVTLEVEWGDPYDDSEALPEWDWHAVLSDLDIDLVSLKVLDADGNER